MIGKFQLRKANLKKGTNVLIGISDENSFLNLSDIEEEEEGGEFKAVICPDLSRFTCFQNFKRNQVLLLIADKSFCLNVSQDKDMYIYMDWNELCQYHSLELKINFSKEEEGLI